MSYCCSQCDFTAQFESALKMHYQLHHETSADDDFPTLDSPNTRDKPLASPKISPSTSPVSQRYKNRGIRLPLRTTSSATRLFGRIKARICKSKTLFVHPEESTGSALNVLNNFSVPSECTSKALKERGMVSNSALTTCLEDQKETYGCHLCSFDADRITVLDRHLLNDHKIGLENLLKLVMAKTKDGLSEDPLSLTYGLRQPYYKAQDELLEEGEFIIENVAPKIKILKHASTNTEKDLSLEDNCRMISKEIEDVLQGNKDGNEDLMSKMQTLNKYMCKFVNSSNALKKMLSKDFETKGGKETIGEQFFNFGLGDRDTPRDWEKAHSERMERNRTRADKLKLSSESFYF